MNVGQEKDEETTQQNTTMMRDLGCYVMTVSARFQRLQFATYSIRHQRLKVVSYERGEDLVWLIGAVVWAPANGP